MKIQKNWVLFALFLAALLMRGALAAEGMTISQPRIVAIGSGAPAVTAAPTPAEPPCSGAFRAYLCAAHSVQLPVFGANFFQASSSFHPLESGVVPNDYALGVGDSFSLRLWGQIDADLSLTVDRAGMVYVPKVGNIAVVGVPFGSLKAHLSNEIGKVFRNFDLAVTMGQLRAVQVFMVGFVRSPGSYSLSSLSTVVNALYAAGGPASNGSMRTVELRRGGALVSSFDLYDFILKGDKSKDVLLQNGDVIYVAPVGAQVALYGAVKAPAVFELKGAESIQSLVDWAGGLNVYARDGRVSVERVEANKSRTLASVTLGEVAKFPVRDGDVVEIYSLTQRVEEGVTLRGSVAQNIRLPWSNGMRVTDLIQSKDMLVRGEFWTRGVPAVGDTTQMASSAAVVTTNLEVNWDYAVIERLNPVDFTTSLIPFNLGQAVLERKPEANLVLQKGDVVHVFSKQDIRVPSQKQARYVRVDGEVAAPGIYQVEEGETLPQLVSRIGGLTRRAFLFGAEFSRESIRARQQQELNRLADYLEESAQSNASTRGQNAITSSDIQGAQLAVAEQRARAQKLRASASGRLVLGMDFNASKLSDLPAFALEDGDHLFVPTKPTTVQVIGAVFNRNSAFVYDPGSSIGDYLGLSGGPTELGDAKSTFVIRANGAVMSAKQRDSWFSRGLASVDALPGDAIIVPDKVDRTTFMKNLMDWSQILANFGLSAAAIKSLSN
jgi:polysaccharide biosynthesis/export protein